MKYANAAKFPISVGMDKVEEALVETLKEYKFGILTEIDVKATFKKKMDVDMPPYKILGACSPPRAKKVLDADPELGIFLPCNIILYEKDDYVNISLTNASAMFELIDNPAIEDVAKDVTEVFGKVLETLKDKFQ